MGLRPGFERAICWLSSFWIYCIIMQELSSLVGCEGPEIFVSETPEIVLFVVTGDD